MHKTAALILAGGRGTRFWPLSRHHRPKQLLAPFGGPTLLVDTVDRLFPLVPPRRTYVVTAADLAEAVRDQLPDVPRENILVEPEGRGTAPGVGWGTVEIARREGPDTVVYTLPSDHTVGRPEVFRAALRGAAEAAEGSGALVLLGIHPSRPETGYGWVAPGPEVGVYHGQPVRRVGRFVEKPGLDDAKRYLAQGWLWNAGVFVFQASALLAAFRRHLPRSGEALDAIAASPRLLAERWRDLDATSLDYGILERHADVLVAPCGPDWSDVGTWTEAAARWPEGEGGRALAAEVAAVDARRCAVYAPGKTVGLLGVEDLIVVDTEDALLIARADRVQDVRQVVGRLRKV